MGIYDNNLFIGILEKDSLKINYFIDISVFMINNSYF